MRRPVLALRRLAVLLVLVVLAVPATAGAQTTAPPGISGADQYLETIPGADGPDTGTAPGSGSTGSGSVTTPSGSSTTPESGTRPGSGSQASGAVTLPPGTARRLGDTEAGRRAAALASLTAPRRTGGLRDGTRRGSDERIEEDGGFGTGLRVQGTGVAGDEGSIIKTVTGSTSGDGWGILLPIFLVLALLVALLLFFLRRRRTAE